MFRPVVAIIRSLSFDIVKIILYNCAAVCLMRRSPTPTDNNQFQPGHTQTFHTQRPIETNEETHYKRSPRQDLQALFHLSGFLCVYSYLVPLFLFLVSDITE